jgi:hypothetical protein
MNSHKTYSVFISNYGLPTVVSKWSLTYPDFVQSGYQEVFSGTKAECEAYADGITESFNDSITDQN